jgi:hypothetical protein
MWQIELRGNTSAGAGSTCISRVAASNADTPSTLDFDGVAAAGTAAAAAEDDTDGEDDAAAGTLSPLCVTDARASLLAPLPTVPD